MVAPPTLLEEEKYQKACGLYQVSFEAVTLIMLIRDFFLSYTLICFMVLLGSTLRSEPDTPSKPRGKGRPKGSAKSQVVTSKLKVDREHIGHTDSENEQQDGVLVL